MAKGIVDNFITNSSFGPVEPPKPARYVAHWRYDDGSNSGVLPIVLDEKQLELLKLAERTFGFEKTVEFVRVESE